MDPRGHQAGPSTESPAHQVQARPGHGTSGGDRPTCQYQGRTNSLVESMGTEAAGSRGPADSSPAAPETGSTSLGPPAPTASRGLHPKVFLHAGPLATAAVLGLHPSDPALPWWLTMHLLLLGLFTVTGLSVLVLVRGLRGIAAGIARLAAVAFVIAHGAGDAVAGVTTGILARRAILLPEAERPGVEQAIEEISRDATKGALFDIAFTAWALALLAAGVALLRARRSRAPVALLALSALAALALGAHEPPGGPATYGLFFAGAVLAEIARWTTRAPRAPGGAGT